MAESKREQIMTELRKRLAAAFPDSQIDRGFREEQVTTYNHFYFLDLPEQYDRDETRRRGQYEILLPVSISYWVQADPKEIHTIGNELLEKIRLAVEQDEYFAGLVRAYYLDEGALIWYDEGVLDVEMLFTFEYTKDAGWVKKPFKH